MKKRRLTTLAILLLMLSYPLSAERAMYVDDFANILGDMAAEHTLLSYAQQNQIETLLLYDLHIIHNTFDLTNAATNTVLADFIYEAKNTYGILKIGATAESGDYFTQVIDVYNNSRPNPLERFDIYNLEFEYWNHSPTAPGGYYCNNYLTPNGYSCDNAGAFQFFIAALQQIRSLADNSVHTISTEAYVGWPTAAQAATIGSNLDLLRMHAYLDNPNSAFSYAENRLLDFASGNPDLPVSIIYSAEPVFMKTWLENNSMSAAENIFISDWTNASSGGSNTIDLVGFTYFTYTQMANVLLPVELKTFSAKQADKQVILHWETLIESNSDYFEIERSEEEKGDWSTIGRVKAAGESASLLNYEFVDQHPNLATNYYRLKQVDVDGRFDFSAIVHLHFSDHSGQLKVYPTVANEQLFIESKEEIVSIFLFNVKGEMLRKIEYPTANYQQIDLNGLATGVYWGQVFFKTGVEGFCFIKEGSKN